MAKKRNRSVSMEISTDTATTLPQAMDMSEVTDSKPLNGAVNRKLKKAIPMKRTKNLRKKKAIGKAISKIEQSGEKISKNKIKTQRILSAKTLYD